MLTFDHPRASWLGSEPWLTDSPRFHWDPVNLIVIHWPGHDGVVDGDPGENPDDVPGFVRQMQRNYRVNRGYNLGYSVLVDWLGGTWEGRGDTFKCAANAGLNDRAIAIQVMTDLDGRITQEAINGVRRMVAQVRSIKPAITIIGHRQGTQYNPAATATACPGPLLELVTSGVFGAPPASQPPANPPGPTTGTYTVQAGDGWFRIGRKLGVEVGPLLAVNGKTLTSMLHPGDVLKVPGTATQPGTAPDWVTLGASMATPSRDVELVYGRVHENVTWFMAVLCSIPKLPADGGGPLIPPEWVGTDRVAGGPATINLFGDATRNAYRYWQSKNDLVGASWYRTMTKLAELRGR